MPTILPKVLQGGCATDVCDSIHARLRIGIVGARTRHQGIGEHVARHFAALGHEVTAIAGSSSESAALASQHLRQTYNIVTRGYASVEALLKSEPVDAVAICSPDRFHRQHLQAALEHRVHILCEKPLVFEPGRDPADDAAPLLAASHRFGKVLMVNEQWPYTLPSFAAIYPAATNFERTPQKITMWLSPSMTGAAMIPNAVPHLLSLVWRLCPAGGAVDEINVESQDPTSKANEIRFAYRHRSGTTLVSLELRQVQRQPRPAGYAIDGHRARRVVEMSPYKFSLEAVDPGGALGDAEPIGRRARMPDPLAMLAADFVRRVQRCRAGQPAWHDTTLLERLQALGKIARAADGSFASCSDL